MFQLISTILAVVLIAVDQIVKNWAAETLIKGDITIIDNVLYDKNDESLELYTITIYKQNILEY